MAFLVISIALTMVVLKVLYFDFSDLDPETALTSQYVESTAFLEGDARNAILGVSNVIQGISVNTSNDYYYYYTDGEKVITNLASEDVSFFDTYKGERFTFKEGHWLYNKKENYLVRESNLDLNGIGYIAFKTEYLNNAQKNWTLQRAQTLPFLVSLVGTLIGILVLLIYLTVTIGRTHKKGPLVLTTLDQIPTDIFLLIYMLLGGLWVVGMNSFYNLSLFITSQFVASKIAVGTISFLFIVVSGFFYLSLVRRIKGKQLVKGSLLYKFFYGIYDFFKSLFDGRSFKSNQLTVQLFKRQVSFIIISFILVLMTYALFFSTPLFFLPPIAELFIIYWYVKGNNKTYKAIDLGFNASLEEQMKAERMKIQLVTNVSHDLKTPLTSIISYADLLSKDETLTESSRDYVNILIDKSNRLKNIVADLFDLAKSTSGDIQLEFENIDLKKLIEQTLADMGDEIEKSTLQFKVKLPEAPVMVLSDGKKMYRVFQNLIDNTLKYAMQGTRVFIDLESTGNKATVSIKNTAGYEMDFNADEILQRFSRGDTSRTTEGNGLGLSIAESFTQVCGGDFLLNVDGDLFKVTLQFDKINSEG